MWNDWLLKLGEYFKRNMYWYTKCILHRRLVWFNDDFNTLQFEIILLYNQQNNDNICQDTKERNGSEYEFKLLVRVNELNETFQWDGSVYNRHGGGISSWWKFSKNDKLCIQVPNINDTDINENDHVICVYVKKGLQHIELWIYEIYWRTRPYILRRSLYSIDLLLQKKIEM